MRIASLTVPLLGGLLLLACRRSSPVTRPSEENSVKERVAELEQQINGVAPRVSNAEARRLYERDLEEIRGIGLVDRAQHDFSTRLTDARIDKWTIGYFVDTNTVWCDVRYRLPGGSEILQQEFGYTRKEGTNWSLLWRAQ